MIHTKPNRLQITKLDAALRQLETAIVLWFNDCDPIFCHTLINAAYQILYDLNKHQNGPPMLPDLPASDIIRPESRKEVKRALRLWANFMKHADNDPTATIFFNSECNEYLLFSSIESYSILTKETRPILQCFRIWFALTHSNFFPREFIERITKAITANKIRRMTKIEFFNEVLPIFTSNLITSHSNLQ